MYAQAFFQMYTCVAPNTSMCSICFDQFEMLVPSIQVIFYVGNLMDHMNEWNISRWHIYDSLFNYN